MSNFDKTIKWRYWDTLCICCLCRIFSSADDELWEDFKIVSFDCPNCTNSKWTSIINVQGKFQSALFILGDPAILQYQAPRPIPRGWSSPTMAWLRNSVDSTSSSRSTLAPKCFARQNTLMDSWREMLQSRFGLTRVIRSTSRRSLRISTMFPAPPLGSKSYKQSVRCDTFHRNFS